MKFFLQPGKTGKSAVINLVHRSPVIKRTHSERSSVIW